MSPPTELPLVYSLKGGRSRLELYADRLVFAAPLRGIAEESVALSTFRFFCIDRMQSSGRLRKLMLDFNADVVLAWEVDGVPKHVRIAIQTESPELKTLLAKLSELRPSSNLDHLSVPEALRLMKVPSRNRDVAIILGVVLLGALLIVGTVLWMLRDL
jgi:hypothetical protein